MWNMLTQSKTNGQCLGELLKLFHRRITPQIRLFMSMSLLVETRNHNVLVTDKQQFLSSPQLSLLFDDWIPNWHDTRTTQWMSMTSQQQQLSNYRTIESTSTLLCPNKSNIRMEILGTADPSLLSVDISFSSFSESMTKSLIELQSFWLWIPGGDK